MAAHSTTLSRTSIHFTKKAFTPVLQSVKKQDILGRLNHATLHNTKERAIFDERKEDEFEAQAVLRQERELRIRERQ